MDFDLTDMEVAYAAARGVLDMHEQILQLKMEVKRLQEYERSYKELLDSSTQHGKQMMAGTLNLLLTPGVVEACQKNRAIDDDDLELAHEAYMRQLLREQLQGEDFSGEDE